jgi:hypothetical protein
MLSALLRAGRSLIAGLSCLSTPDSILMSYQNLRASTHLALTDCGRRTLPIVHALPTEVRGGKATVRHDCRTILICFARFRQTLPAPSCTLFLTLQVF